MVLQDLVTSADHVLEIPVLRSFYVKIISAGRFEMGKTERASVIEIILYFLFLHVLNQWFSTLKKHGGPPKFDFKKFGAHSTQRAYNFCTVYGLSHAFYSNKSNLFCRIWTLCSSDSLQFLFLYLCRNGNTVLNDPFLRVVISPLFPCRAKFTSFVLLMKIKKNCPIFNTGRPNCMQSICLRFQSAISTLELFFVFLYLFAFQERIYLIID
jgi:hypothetical protein